MMNSVLQLALTLAGAYLSFYVANGPCNFSGEFSATCLQLKALNMLPHSIVHGIACHISY